MEENPKLILCRVCNVRRSEEFFPAKESVSPRSNVKFCCTVAVTEGLSCLAREKQRIETLRAAGTCDDD